MRLIKHVMMIAGVAIPAMALAADSVTMTAGRWESKIAFLGGTLDGVAIPADLPEDVEAEFNCIAADEAADPKIYFMRNQQGDSCKPSGTVANGKLSVTAQCNSSEMAGTMVLNGTYAAQSYDFDSTIDAVGVKNGKKLKARSRITGRYVGACKGDEV